jgi:hypothetical protein
MGREIQYIKTIESLVLKKKIFKLLLEELTSKHLYIEWFENVTTNYVDEEKLIIC